MTARFTFDATFPDGSPRRTVGTHRPTFEDALTEMTAEPGRFRYGVLVYEGRAREAWISGECDRPLYAIEDDERD